MQEDTTAFIPCAFLLMFSVSVKNGATSDESTGILTKGYFIANCVAIVCLVLAALIFHLIYYKQYRNFKKRTMLSAGLIAVALGFLTNGFFYTEYVFTDFLLGLSFGLLYYGVYILFFHTIKWKKDFSMRYLAFVMFFMGLLISAELGLLYMVTPELRATFNKNLVWLGWGLSNAIAFIFMLTIPFGFYLTYKAKFSLLYFLGTTIMLLAVIFTFSRGSLIIAVPLYVAGTIFVCLFAKNRLPLWIASGIFLICAAVVVISYREQLIKMLNFYIETGLNDRGRFDLWKEGFEAWLSSPVFGVGLMYRYGDKFNTFTWFHNTLIHFLATGGIVGIATYLYHRVQTIIMFLKKMSMERLFAGVAIACLLVNSLLDVAMSCQHIILFYGIILAFCEKDMLFTLGKIDENGNETDEKEQAERLRRDAAEKAAANPSDRGLSAAGQNNTVTDTQNAAQAVEKSADALTDADGLAKSRNEEGVSCTGGGGS